MKIESFLLAITTFFSVAQLTCVITVPDYKKRLSGHFLKWYFISAIIMILVTFFGKNGGEQASRDLLMYGGFLLFVHVFNEFLADKITSK